MKYGVLETGEVFNSRRDIVSSLNISVTSLKRHLGKLHSWFGLTLYRIKEKTCRTCGIVLTKEIQPDIKRCICVSCHRSYANSRSRGYRLKAKYNLSVPEYEDILKSQDYRCAACRTHESTQRRKLAVDHDHLTGCIRGLLCDNCNRGLGLLGDNLESLNRVIDYLKSPAQK